MRDCARHTIFLKTIFCLNHSCSACVYIYHERRHLDKIGHFHTRSFAKGICYSVHYVHGTFYEYAKQRERDKAHNRSNEAKFARREQLSRVPFESHFHKWAFFSSCLSWLHVVQ